MPVAKCTSGYIEEVMKEGFDENTKFGEAIISTIDDVAKMNAEKMEKWVARQCKTTTDPGSKSANEDLSKTRQTTTADHQVIQLDPDSEIQIPKTFDETESENTPRELAMDETQKVKQTGKDFEKTESGIESTTSETDSEIIKPPKTFDEIESGLDMMTEKTVMELEMDPDETPQKVDETEKIFDEINSGIESTT